MSQKNLGGFSGRSLFVCGGSVRRHAFPFVVVAASVHVMRSAGLGERVGCVGLESSVRNRVLADH